MSNNPTCQVRFGVIALPTSHAPPAGRLWTNARIIMRGDTLLLALRAGKKTLSTRLWCANTVKRMQRLVHTRACVRIQTNYEYDSICGWSVLKSVSDLAPAINVVTEGVVRAAGVGDMSVAEYIKEFCSVEKPDGTVSPGMVAIVQFGQFWPVIVY